MSSPLPPTKSLWSEYKNSEGRVYWSHAQSKQSVWEKPDELRTPFERALNKTNWKQYVSKDRPYYVNGVTKETKWELPAELRELKRRVEVQEVYGKERERRRAAGEPRSPTPEHLQARSGNALAAYNPGAGNRDSPAPRKETIVIPPGGFLTHEKAEGAFMHLLKREGVDESWTWDQTMRKIIMDPLYKALDTLAQKKTAFEKYTNGIIEDRQADKEARITKLRPILHRLFATSPHIKVYSTMKTAEKAFAHDRHWREAKPDERRLFLDESITDLRHREEVLGSLLRQLGITVSTRWRAAHDIILSSPHWRADTNLQKIDTIDMLGVYDDFSRQLMQEHEEESRRHRIETVRRARKAREGFKMLLHELRDRGELTRLSKWKDTLPKIHDDERYAILLGMPGSSPLDLWMDAVDDMGEEAERAAEKIERAVAKEEKAVKVETSWEEFEGLLREVHIDSQIDVKLRKEVYDMVHERLVQVAADEARRAERKRRHRIDDLRYALKKVQRHIDLDMTYEEAVPHMNDLDEFKDIPEEEDRQTAFEKFVRRQKEKLREAESSEVGSTRSNDRRYPKAHREEVVDEPERERKSDWRRDEERRANGRDREREREKDKTKDKTKDKDRWDERSGTDGRERVEEKKEHRSFRRDARERDRGRDRDGEKEYDRDRDRERKERKHPVDGEANGRESKRPKLESGGAEKPSDKNRSDVEEGEI